MFVSLFVSVLLGGGPEVAALKIQPNGALRHPSTVRAIAITPDSRTAFVGLNDGQVLAYSMETRKAVEVGVRNHSVFHDLALNGRGDRLAVVDGSGHVTLFDTTTLESVKKAQLKADPENVIFHPEGDILYVAMANGHLARLRAADLSVTHDIFPTQGSRVLALACSVDGRTIATSDRDGRIKLWDADNLEHITSWKAHETMARSLCFEPSGKYLLSGGDEAILKVWNARDHTLVKEVKEVHQLAIESITTLRDGRYVTGGYDGLCQFWDKEFKTLKSHSNFRGTIHAMASSADGRWLVRGGSTLEFVPLDNPEKVERVAEYGGAIMSMTVAADMKRFVSGGLDRRLIQWRVDRDIDSKIVLADDWITSVEFCRDDRCIAVGLANGKIELREEHTLRRENSWTAHKGRVTGIAALGNDRIVSIGEDGKVHLWNMNGDALKSIDEKSSCRAVAVRENRFAVGTANGTVSVYEADGTLVKRLRGRPQTVTALCFSGGGTRLMVGYFDGGLESFDVESWNVVHFRPGTGESVLSINANMKSNWIAVGFRDGAVRIVDVVTLKEGGNVRISPAREVFAVRWALNENTFAAAGATNGIAFYRLQTENGGGTSNAVVLNVQDRLTANGGFDRVRQTSYAKVFNARLEKGRSYTIDLTSADIDMYLRVEDSFGNQLAEDDDGGEGLNSRLVFTARESGTYRIVATTYQADVTGNFHLRVMQR
jgi:WD40 repeat protein